MPVLADIAINAHAQNGMISPYNFNHLSPSSLDLTLGDTILIESVDPSNDGWAPLSINSTYNVTPQQFILATTAETITLPKDVSAQVVLRSSAARAGWDHCLAGWIDPGFSGQITLELRNNRQLHSLPIQTGMRLVQLVCFSLSCHPSLSYASKGNYQHQRGVTPSNNNFAPIPNAC